MCLALTRVRTLRSLGALPQAKAVALPWSPATSASWCDAQARGSAQTLAGLNYIFRASLPPTGVTRSRACCLGWCQPPLLGDARGEEVGLCWGGSGVAGPLRCAWPQELCLARGEADGGPVARGDISGDFFWRFSSPRLLGEECPLAWLWPHDSWGGGQRGAQQRWLLCPAPFSGSMEHLCAQPVGGQEKQMSGQGGWPRGPEAGEVSGPGCWFVA